MSYSIFLLWATLSLPTLYYVIVPPLYLLHGISLFPKVDVGGIGGYNTALYSGTGSFHRRESISGRKYCKDYRGNRDIKAKKNVEKTIHDLEEASKVMANCSYEKDTQWGKERYEQEIMEFGSSPIMFTMLGTFAMLNIFCLVGAKMKIVFQDFRALKNLISQVIFCEMMVLINLAVYEAMFFGERQGLLTIFCHVQVHCFSFIDMPYNAYDLEKL
ncbi:hypothetical protein EZV62_009220 [Acer yangbiense]|uniref:Uncharacterized protein n=1 Tax=Acer yangbiense TaxID=1000413 RepID=A0A5C7IFZ4_9ROSI|nr:hypothetical protein EZV62_009220 [Acer yangbiense]